MKSIFIFVAAIFTTILFLNSCGTKASIVNNYLSTVNLNHHSSYINTEMIKIVFDSDDIKTLNNKDKQSLIGKSDDNINIYACIENKNIFYLSLVPKNVVGEYTNAKFDKSCTVPIKDVVKIISVLNDVITDWEIKSENRIFKRYTLNPDYEFKDSIKYTNETRGSLEILYEKSSRKPHVVFFMYNKDVFSKDKYEYQYDFIDLNRVKNFKYLLEKGLNTLKSFGAK